MTKKTRTLAWIYIVMCGGFMASGIALCLGIALTDDPGNSRALGTIGAFFFWPSLVYFGPGLIAGIGLLRGRPWARTVLIVLCLAVLLAIPVGTVLGGYGLWVLLGKDFKQQPPAPPPRTARPAEPLLPSAEGQRVRGMAVAALGVGSLFIVMIGTGYRVTNTPGSPIGTGLYVIAIIVLIAAIAAGVWHFRQPPAIRVLPLTASPLTEPIPMDAEFAQRPEYASLDARIQELARIIDAPEGLLPTYGRANFFRHAHIEIDGETYHFIRDERSFEFNRITVTSLEELLYITFRDVAFSMATNLKLDEQTPDIDHRRRMYPEQEALMARLNPAWGERCAAEHVEILKEYPFEDGKGP